jgi:KUP system potassium uptake protein
MQGFATSATTRRNKYVKFARFWLVASRLTRESQVFSVSQILLLAYQSVGVIYGDIGTSPLYVYSSTFSEAPNRADLMGALSLIIWSLTLMVTIKYIVVILRADNDGEGGTFSTYSLLSRYVSVPRKLQGAAC